MLAILRVWFETTFGRWITFRSLAVAAIISTTLLSCQPGSGRGAGRQRPAHPDKAADARLAPGMRPSLAPVSIAIERLPLRADGKPRIDVTLNYVNVGHEPARSVVIEMRSGTVPQVSVERDPQRSSRRRQHHLRQPHHAGKGRHRFSFEHTRAQLLADRHYVERRAGSTPSRAFWWRPARNIGRPTARST